MVLVRIASEKCAQNGEADLERRPSWFWLGGKGDLAWNVVVRRKETKEGVAQIKGSGGP